jgi:hypothetical protein
MTDRHAAQRRQLIETLQERGIRDLEVLRAFDLVPRHEFLPEAVRHRAYEDSPIPIGYGQTASQPSLQALYMQILRLEARDRVLEIGTGSGFQTAVLARLADRVYSVERIRELGVRARDTLERLRVSNVAILVGDGTIGWSRYAPYGTDAHPRGRARRAAADAGEAHGRGNAVRGGARLHLRPAPRPLRLAGAGRGPALSRSSVPNPNLAPPR